MPSALPPLVLSAALVCAAVGAAGAADWVVPPPTHPLAEPLPAKPAVRKGADFIDLENQHVLLRLAWRPGLVLERLRNKHTARECLPLGASRLFAVLPDDAGHAWVGSDRFKVEEVVGTADPGVGAQAQVTVELTCAELSLAATLSVTVGPSEETLWRLRMRNSGATARKLCLCFPMLERTVLGEDSADDYYFFPMVGGWCANLPYELGVPYGTLPGSLQVLAAFNPTAGGGVYLYPRDSTGRVKVMLLRKVARDGGRPPAYIPLFDPALNREPAYTPSPFADGPGTSLGVRTLWVTLAPGAMLSPPPVVIAAYAGDFRQPLESYSRWVRTWWGNPGAPDWVRGSASFCYAHDEDSIRAGRYVARPKIEPAHQVMQWAYWWRHSDRNRVGEDPKPDRWYRENHGDYEYEGRWGGVEALRQEVQRYRAAGSRMVFYLQSYLAWKHSAVALAHREDWGAMWPDGTYNDDYSDEKANQDCWGMCPRAPGWQDYLVGVCDRLMADTHPDGLYLDSLNGAQFCSNPRHQHEREPAPGVRRLLERARAITKHHNPEGILWIEFPTSDYLLQFVDATWLETFSSSCPLYTDFDGFYGLHFLRFYFPEVAYAEWNPDVWRPELQRRNLFNGVGSSAITPYDQVMHDHADAFATLHPQPLVPTEVEGVFANLFPAREKRVWTLWNRTGRVVSGVVLRVPAAPGARYVEAVSGKELHPQSAAGQAAISLHLPAGEVACVVQRFSRTATG